MSTAGLIGFRYQGRDLLTYNHTDSQPDALGLTIRKELSEVKDWPTVQSRLETIIGVPESRSLNEYTTMAETEVRRHFPDLQYTGEPKNMYDLYQPLQGSLKPYLEGKLTFMPDASDFIYDSSHCKWAYITNLDTHEFEVWKGQQTEPDHEDNRYPEEPNRYGNEANKMGYYPCAMVRNYDLKELPNPGLFLTYFSFSEDPTRS